MANPVVYVDTRSGAGVNRGIGRSRSGAHWACFYVEVDDPQAILDRAETLGGTRVYGPRDAGDHLLTGAFRDPAGSVVGVYHRGSR